MLKEYKTLVPYLKKYLIYYIAGIFCLVITDAGLLYIPQFIKKAINSVSVGAFELSLIGRYMIQMVMLAILISIGRFFWRFFIHGASRRIETELREKIFYHLLDMSSAFYGEHKTGDIMARMTNDMKAIRMASGMAFVAFIDGLFMALAILVILFTSYSRLTLITIIPLPFITIIVLFAGKMLGKRFKRVQEAYSAISERVQESFSGISVIKTFTQEEHFLNEFGRDNDEYWAANMSLIRIWGFIFPVVSFLSGITVCLLLLYGGSQLMMNQLNPGNFVAVMSYLAMLIWPMLGAGFTVNLIQRGGASLKRINQILEVEPEISNGESPRDVPIFKELTVNSLNYTFHGSGDSVINDLTLTLRAGETLGILGKTGSGKTTFIRLLPRILESEEGQIHYNGIPLHSLELSSLRSSIAMVPQETILFSRSIRENILYSKEDASEEELARVVHISTLDRDLKNFPDGMETQVGERGVSLSGGQKQRIAFARALLADPELLILDDALSAVDTKTEEFILKELVKLRKGKTNIIISHRVSTLQVSNKILVLRKGSIGQYGSHKELSRQDGLYKRIFDLQSMEQEEQS
ncbi:MAG: ABC transporter [Spirochaetaceae bacterium 4572_59]|nr:MAG: ABC transporter [Spirochaetaceae bacterium 4572_59]